MKKIPASLLLLAALTTGYAQSPSEADPVTAGVAYAAGHPAHMADHPYAINIKAVRNFYDRYGDGNHESWYATDYGFRAKFMQNGIAFMADYNKKGGWITTIKTYSESKLPKDIREKVRREYFDYRIFCVQEIDQRDDVIYLVSLEDTASWMTLRLAGDMMETLAVYKK